jgi:hypothetical protein
MDKVGVFVLVIAGVSAQFDPFPGSRCNCSTFCSGLCAINATGRANITVYRMTPFGVLDLTNKDTGDAPGDTSFVISRKTAGYECMKNPKAPGCSTVTQFTGDVPNSTDLVLAFTIEVDGNWGPYLMCNPANTSFPRGPWKCLTDAYPTPKPWPAQCSAFTGRTGYCPTYPPAERPQVTSLAECCSAAHAAGISVWSYDATANSSCALYSYLNDTAYKPCKEGVVGFSEYRCDCPRVHRTVGRANLTALGGPDHPVGGIWYSHPEGGECAPGQQIGHNGCTWRSIRRERAINASCMYHRIDTVVENAGKACLSQCQQPHNSTSSCYLACYAQAVEELPNEQLVKPWYAAFEQPEYGGCLEVHLEDPASASI